MKDPNQTPGALIAGTIVGGLLTLGPVVGGIGAVLGMIRAFRVLGSSGIADPLILAGEISHALWWTAGGLGSLLIGLPLLITCSVLWIYHGQGVRGQR